MEYKVGISGLGYVGLPLALASSHHFYTIGYDIQKTRIQDLKQGKDHTLEVSTEALRSAKKLAFTSNSDTLEACNFYIITTPTPLDKHKNPDLSALLNASEDIGRYLRRGDIVVYESTVYPGCTEEMCVPVLEKASGLRFNRDFFCGYSPERINPGDKARPLSKIVKITSGSTQESAERVDSFYKRLIRAGTYKATSIRVAEAAKAIENTQRDLNIAFVNELAMLFHKLGMDTHEVLKAASTKWNFLPFAPGLVGGHCIGVDPYYLTHKAESVGYHPQIILSGRRLNDDMGTYVAARIIKLMAKQGYGLAGQRVLILGITFKENCPDIRNSKVIDLVRELESYHINASIYDPVACAKDVQKHYGRLLTSNPYGPYAAVILAVAHRAFKDIEWQRYKRKQALLFDIKGIIPRELVDDRL